MHPALSVILFTVTSGLGYGMLAFIALFVLLQPQLTLEANGINAIVSATGIGLVSVFIGLAFSALHLSNPKNAWRAFFRFRSSWLSKEGVFAVLSFPVAIAFSASIYLSSNIIVINTLALLLILISLLTVFATGMIYACLKTIRAWNTALVPMNYLILSLLSGSIATLSLLNYSNIYSAVIEVSAIILIVMAFLGKIIYYLFIGQPSPLTIKSATGIGFGKVRLLDTGEASDNFLQKEFGYEVSTTVLYTVRVISLFMISIIPMYLLLFLPNYAPAFYGLLAITIINYFGSVAERWLFFAEARHVVNLYYGKSA